MNIENLLNDGSLVEKISLFEDSQLLDKADTLFDFKAPSVDEYSFDDLIKDSRLVESADPFFIYSSPEENKIQEQAFQDEQHYLSDNQRNTYLQQINHSVPDDTEERKQFIDQIISEITADVVLNVRYLEPWYLGRPLSDIKEESDKTQDIASKKYLWFQKKLGVTQLINGKKHTLPTPNSIPHKWTYAYAKSQGKNALEWITDSEGLGRFLKSGGATDDLLYQDQLSALDKEGLLALRNYFTNKGKGAVEIAEIIPIKTRREEQEAYRLLIKNRGLMLANEAAKIINSKNVRKSRK